MKSVEKSKDIKDRTLFVLAIGIVVALTIAIAGDYVTAWFETEKTGAPQEVSSDVMKLAQTALGGVIGVLGGYFGAKAAGSSNPSPEAVAILGRIVTILAFGAMTAVCLAIVGDYVTAAMETYATHQAQEVSGPVMTLVQTALGGIVGIIGSYFGSTD